MMMQSNRKESVLVLEAYAKAAVPVLESCAAMGLHVIAASSKKHCCGFYSKAVTKRQIVNLTKRFL